MPWNYKRKTDRPPRSNRKLTPVQVIAIRDSDEPGPALATRYNVSPVTIWYVRARLGYDDVKGGRPYIPSRQRHLAPTLIGDTTKTPNS